MKLTATTDSGIKVYYRQNRELTKLTLMNKIAGNAKDIIEKVKKAAKGKYHLNDDEWKELLGAIDKEYPEFTYEVNAKLKKSKRGTDACLLPMENRPHRPADCKSDRIPTPDSVVQNKTH